MYYMPTMCMIPHQTPFIYLDRKEWYLSSRDSWLDVAESKKEGSYIVIPMVKEKGR